jgi:hypothetical protein
MAYFPESEMMMMMMMMMEYYNPERPPHTRMKMSILYSDNHTKSVNTLSDM